jgi:murein tripeptide amidase MpaA
VPDSLTPVPYDHWPRYDELSGLLHEWATQRPGLLHVGSIGRSHEGREIWICELTDTATGPAADKPAVWVDANIHSTEVTGGSAALHLVHMLLAGHDGDERIGRALAGRAFYVVPRLNPDGVELALAQTPRYVRSGVRPWPLADEQPGLHASDIDGDGRILMMRIPDETGHWMPHPDHPRLMVPRPADEEGGAGPNYRLLMEGHLVGYDGDIIKTPPDLAGLDFNRNFPYDWQPRGDQEGAGDYPGSEPEIRAAVQAIVDRPNITVAVSYHTFGAVHLRPYGARADDEFPPADLRVYKRVSDEATRLTGYPNASVYHHFQYEPKTWMRGAFDDWIYEHLGVFGWTTEFWSPMKAAGVDVGMRFIDWWKDHPLADDLKMLEWADRELPGSGYVDWYPFQHPQLGAVEIGGWDEMYALGNVPLPLLEAEVAPHSQWALYLALISPRLAVRSLTSEPVGSGAHRVRLVVQNTGWLPTNVSQKAVDRKVVRPLEVDLELPDGARLAAGERHLELGQLAGRPASASMLGWDVGHEPSSERVRAEWVIEAEAGSEVSVTARHPRAGVARASVRL